MFFMLLSQDLWDTRIIEEKRGSTHTYEEMGMSHKWSNYSDTVSGQM